jgi:hypothetical protein
VRGRTLEPKRRATAETEKPILVKEGALLDIVTKPKPFEFQSQKPLQKKLPTWFRAE